MSHQNVAPELVAWTPDPPVRDPAEPGYLDQDFIDRREAYITERDGRVVLNGCADEGHPVNGIELVADETTAMPVNHGILSNFGQYGGLAMATAVVGTERYGAQFLLDTGGFDGLLTDLVEFMNHDQLPFAARPAGHSDRPKEAAARRHDSSILGHSSAFHPIGDAPTGCAYAGNLGRVPGTIGTDPTVQLVAADNLQHLFGRDSDAEGLIEANRLIAPALGARRTIGRQSLAAAGVPVMVLERLGKDDSHISAHQTGLIVNLDPTQIYRPYDHYRIDAAGAALIIRRAVRSLSGGKYDLSARRIMETLVVDSAAVRALLASHDSSGNLTPDPNRIAIGTRGGTLDSAVAAIENIEHDFDARD